MFQKYPKENRFLFIKANENYFFFTDSSDCIKSPENPSRDLYVFFTFCSVKNNVSQSQPDTSRLRSSEFENKIWVTICKNFFFSDEYIENVTGFQLWRYINVEVVNVKYERKCFIAEINKEIYAKWMSAYENKKYNNHVEKFQSEIF